MGIERVSHYIDNVLTEAQARMGLRDTRLLVTWYTNRENKQSVVHSHPYHELVLPIGGSTVRYSVDGSVYLVHVGELVYFPSQVYHSGNFNIDDAQSDRLVIQIDDALWQATRRRVNCRTPSGISFLRRRSLRCCCSSRRPPAADRPLPPAAPVYWSRARWPTCRRIIRTRP